MGPQEPKILMPMLILGGIGLLLVIHHETARAHSKISTDPSGVRRVARTDVDRIIASWADKRVASPRSEALPGPHAVCTLLDPQAVPNVGDTPVPAQQWLDAILASGNTVLISPTDPKVVVVAPAVTAEVLANPSKGGKYAILKP